MSMKIYYARVSTEQQHIERQTKAAEEIKADKIYIEKESGKTTNRKVLKEMMQFAREGDTVIVESFSRAARNTKELLQFVEDLTAKGIRFISQKENIDTETPQGKFMLTVFAAVAELERESLLQRQREGIECAKNRGAYKGKPQMKIDKDKFIEVAKRWRNKEITATAAMKELNLKPNTFYRRVSEWKL